MAHKNTILIVDDEPSARDTLEALLFREGFDLAFAGNGPEALEKATTLTPDLILLDVMMPGMDGFQVCWQLRADPLLAEVPVIMITALDDRDSRLRGIEVGADDFVSKPFDRIELRTRVRATLRLNRYRRLLTERTKFEWVVEQAEDGYLIVNDDDEILYANPQARLYLGLPPGHAEQIVGDKNGTWGTFLDWARKQYHCEPQESWVTWPGQQAGGSPSPRYLVRPQSPTAGVFWLQVDGMPMPSQSNLVRLHDVTADIVTQSKMWAFHSLVSHKLRTPLSPLIGFLELLLHDDLSTLSEAEIKDCIASSHQGATRLQDAILGIFRYMDVVSTSKPVHDRCSLAKIPTLMSEIETGLGIVAVSIAYHNVQNPDGIFALISCHSVELILWELCENAKKFHPEGSPVIEMSIARVPDGVRIQVRDDGRTLSPEQMAQMWHPYYQGDSSFSGEVPGMGLGLAMVAALVYGAGGTCRAHNREEGPGVIIELVLPSEVDDGKAQE